MRHFIYTLLTLGTIFMISCRDDFYFESQSDASLRFSKDTVYLDTVFTNIGSSTYTLKVYNTSNKDIKIPSIRLANGDTSLYRITVDGMTGNNNKSFENVELLAKDSLFIFIETTINYEDFANNSTTFLYTDQIMFNENTSFEQKVDLVTLVQDAVFLYPQKDNQGNYESAVLGLDSEGNAITVEKGFELSENDPENGNELIWTNQKPYVIYGSAVVPTGKTLEVQKGARVHFHSEAGLYVKEGATLSINGEISQTEALENEVIFEGDRLEPAFSEIAGQWGAVVIFSNSNNSINHLTLKNATAGIVLQRITNSVEPRLTIGNSQIYNCSNVGILARAAQITGYNTVINRAGQAGLACVYGGNYTFTHCTFANYWNRPNQYPALLNDYIETTEGTYTNTLQTNFTNCIFYGTGSYGIALEKKGTADLGYLFNHCVIKFTDSNLINKGLYLFTDASHYPNCYIAHNVSTYNPKFVDPYNNILRLGQTGIETLSGVSTVYTSDILGNPRTGVINLGAYQFIAD